MSHMLEMTSWEVEPKHVMHWVSLSVDSSSGFIGVEPQYEPNIVLLYPQEPGKPVATELKVCDLTA